MKRIQGRTRLYCALTLFGLLSAGYLAGAAGALLLAASALWWRGEASWGRFEPLTPEQAFVDGSFGLNWHH